MHDYKRLVSGIRECNRCFFRDPLIQPIAPSYVKPPVDIMFIGENPSWDKDQEEPFDYRTVSGCALNRNYLAPLGLGRDKVWITDLFKCRYPKEIYRAKSEHEKRIQDEVVSSCKVLLVNEINLAKPKIVVTLSDKQVYQRFRKVFNLDTPRTFEIASGKAYSISIDSISTYLFPMVHPDISRPVGQGDNRKLRSREKWASIHAKYHIQEFKRLIKS